MHRLMIALATTVIAAGGSVAAAAPVGPGAGLSAAADAVALGETVQYVLEAEPSPYVWGGYPYCWYLDGWHGPVKRISPFVKCIEVVRQRQTDLRVAVPREDRMA